MSEEKNFEVELQKLKLEENDNLVVRLNTTGLSEGEMLNRLSEIRNDDFIKYIENKGHKVFVTYNGIKLEILRMEETDKLVVYVDTTNLKGKKEKEDYLDYVKMKLVDIDEKLIIVPMDNESLKLRVVKEGEEI